MGSTTYLDDSGNPTSAPSATYLDDSGNPIQSVGDTSASIGPAPSKTPFDALVGEADYTQEGRAEHPVLSRVNDFMKNVRSYGDLIGSIAKTGIVPFGEIEGAAPTAEEIAATAKPGLVNELLKGKEVAQPEAQKALLGVSGATKPGQVMSIREGLSNPIDMGEAAYKNLYSKIDQAAGTDIKALREKLANTEYQIRQLTDTEADQALEAKLETARQGLIDKIAEANQLAIKNGVAPDTLEKADQMYQQTQALKDVESKVFKNVNIVIGNTRYGTNETINIDAAIKALQRLQDNTKYGAPRLEQAFGKDAADNLLAKLYAAQEAGKAAQSTMNRAVAVRDMAKWIVGALGVGGAAYEGMKAATGAIKGASK